MTPLITELRAAVKSGKGNYGHRLICGQAAAEIEILRSALVLTEGNLRRLIAARHCDEVLMSPWLEVVRDALNGMGSSGPERALQRTSGRAIANAGIDSGPVPSSQSQRSGDTT